MSLTLLAAAAVLQAASLATTPADRTSAEAEAVLAPVNAVFAALAARDGALVTPHLDGRARITVAIEGPEDGATVRRLTGQAFADSLRPGPERLEEVMPDPLVAIDGDIAMVFGRYIFRVDGAVSHCGSNHFDLIREDGDWKIAAITWNQRTTGCDG